MKLNLGCSNHYFEGFVNLDINKEKDIYGQECKVDVVHDLNVYPYPFEDNTFEYIHASAVIEHLDDVIKTMKEIKRILKPGGVVYILVPHFSAWLNHSDPSHKWMFSISMANHSLFNQGMEVIESEIVYSENKFLKIFNFLPNLFPKFYERFYAYIFPSNFATWRLRKR